MASDCLIGTSARAESSAHKLGQRGAVALDPAVGLLEDQARRERQRLVPRIARREESRKDQHALGMDRAAQLHFALDVDHFALAEAGVAVIRVGWPKAKLPSSITERPLTCP